MIKKGRCVMKMSQTFIRYFNLTTKYRSIFVFVCSDENKAFHQPFIAEVRLLRGRQQSTILWRIFVEKCWLSRCHVILCYFLPVPCLKIKSRELFRRSDRRRLHLHWWSQDSQANGHGRELLTLLNNYNLLVTKDLVYGYMGGKLTCCP